MITIVIDLPPGVVIAALCGLVLLLMLVCASIVAALLASLSAFRR